MIAMIALASLGASIAIIGMEARMAKNLVVRNVDEDIVFALKQLAASHGRSAVAEHREILRTAPQRPKRRSVKGVPFKNFVAWQDFEGHGNIVFYATI